MHNNCLFFYWFCDCLEVLNTIKHNENLLRSCLGYTCKALKMVLGVWTSKHPKALTLTLETLLNVNTSKHLFGFGSLTTVLTDKAKDKECIVSVQNKRRLFW